MDDLISRQAAIDVADKFSDADGCNGSDVAMDIISGLISLPSAQPEPKWIPCSERLPKSVAPSKRREWFITSNTYGGVNVTCYEFEASPFKEGWQTDMTVLAWMTLPEPYKGEQE